MSGPALLARADPELRREVESLLARQSEELLLDRPAPGTSTESLEATRIPMPIAGTSLGPYRIEGKLGEGGMGEVFRAVDTRLGRAVAIKITHERFSARFDREARAISSLNHPNICTLYDVGPNYLVMELVEGETLAARLKNGPLPADLALRYGTQILAALAEAHGKGIVHRDLKPGNVMLTKTGVKVLDFGLAALTGEATLTAAGMVMGTPAYMAPEQARGETATRADIWAWAWSSRNADGCAARAWGRGAHPRRPSSNASSRNASKGPIARFAISRGRAAARSSSAVRAGRRPVALGWPVGPLASRRCRRRGSGSPRAPTSSRRAATLTDKDTIVLADFTNTTGDPVFDDTLRQGLAVQLQQSPFLSLISDERIRRTLLLMNQSADARLTPEIAQGVCVRTGSAAVLEGLIAALGSQYVLGLRATNCTSGDILAEEQAQAARKENVLSTLSQMATRFRTRVGESLATIERYSTPLEATTPSLEALQAYSAGFKAGLAGSNVRALALFQRAVAIDPDFASAHAHAGFRYGVTGESALARQSLIKAYQLRNRASDVERFYIEHCTIATLRGIWNGSDERWKRGPRATRAMPRPHTLIAGLALSSTGQYELAIAETEKAIALDPDLTPAYVNRAFNQLSLNRLDDALLTVRLAAERKLESASLLLTQYFVAFLAGNENELRRTVTAARKSPATEDTISHIEALALARSGQLQDARRMGEIAVQIAQKSGQRERAGLFEAATAVWEAFYGNAAAARQSATRALELGRGGREVDYAAAFALALAGDLPQSRALAEVLASGFPEDTSVQFMYLPALQALLSLNTPTPDAAAAIQALQTASRYDLALGRVGFVGRFGGLYPIYVRGLAYLSARQPAEAAAEFQRILDHRSIVLVDPMDAMARLQLARSLALSGDTAKAKGAYDDLLALWKDADPGIPTVNQARAEYAKLQ